MPYIQIKRARYPNGQGWISYEATAARILGMDLYEEMYDYDWLTRTYDIESPKGWSSVDELNAAVQTLDKARYGPARDAIDEDTPPQPEVTTRCESRAASPIETIRQSP